MRMQGDASTRSYERLALGDKHVILMNLPRRPDGPPVRGGKPYSAIAHLADRRRAVRGNREGPAAIRLLGTRHPRTPIWTMAS